VKAFLKARWPPRSCTARILHAADQTSSWSTDVDDHIRPVTPSRRGYWTLAAAILLGIALGLGVFTFGYAKGYSYLGHDPAACANCHIMSEHFAAWTKGSHHTVATCNDCHTPHNVVGKYAVKAKNGFWHSFYFTTGGYPDPLRITEGNRKVTEATCRHCHQQITEAIDHSDAANRTVGDGDESREKQPMSCVRCHRYVGHWVR
jgi:cytochrome c nitrite reductase small subunit